MNNNIEEAEINFTNAKLLFEKGFDVKCSHRYNYLGILEKFPLPFDVDYKNLYNYQTRGNGQIYLAPNIQTAVEWIYVNFGIWISVELTDNSRDYYFQPIITTSKDRELHDEDMIDQAKTICKYKEWQYNTPQEAYQAVIEYTLLNLIP